ncbi:MAG: hypothetical protein RL464_797 [Actinomycetota bacterium]
MSKTQVAIICGGRSSEHEISCISASGVFEAIDRSNYEPILIGITKTGNWTLLNGKESFTPGEDGLPSVPERKNELSISSAGIKKESGELLEVDLAFPVLHGAYGEDGTIQGLFEMAGIAYVGSGVLASSVAMDKTFAKPIYADFGMKVADGITVHQRDWHANQAMEIAKISALGFPLFVKPARSGSSRGTTKVKDASGIPAAINAAHRHDPRAMVEVAIKGREIECAVLEIDGTPHASVLGEVRVHTSFDVPADIPENLSKEIREAAITAFTALGCEGLARVDFFLTETSEVIINELNTMPGFTPRSVFPMLWEATGKSYREIITELCRSALGRSQNVVR